MAKDDKWGLTSYIEAETGDGKVIRIRCLPEKVDEIKEMVRGSIYSLSISSTECVVEHGGYCFYSRFEIERHRYAACPVGFIEVLEIKNPLEGKSGFVIYEYTSGGTSYGDNKFSEWKTLEAAIAAYEGVCLVKPAEEFEGHIRTVFCGGGALMPWFWAVGDQAIIGDFAFPEGLQDDPVYTTGRKFMVCVDELVPTGKYDEEKCEIYDQRWELKTCMGCRVYREDERRPYRVVYFDDGTCWDEYRQHFPPRPINEMPQIFDAMNKFVNLLMQKPGNGGSFEIRLPDGRLIIAKGFQESLNNF